MAVVHRDPHVSARIASLLRSRADFVVRSGIPAHADADVLVEDYATGMHRATTPTSHPRGVAAGSCLVVTDQDSGWSIRRAVDAGIRGYLLHDCSASQAGGRGALHCRRAQGTCPVWRPTGCWTASRRHAHGPRTRPAAVHCTRLADKDFGLRLGTGEGTVKTHVKAILRKLDEPTRTAEALRRGLLGAAATAASSGT